MTTSTSPPSTRIIVKNLPKWITQDRLSQHFSQKGQITDIKLMYTRSGVFRRFAYIGFSGGDEAAAAVKFFNNTFLDTLRMEVDFAKRIGSEDISRPWSKYSQGSSKHEEYLQNKFGKSKAKVEKASDPAENLRAELERKKKLIESIFGEGEDSELKSFAEATRSASKTKVWANDDNAEGGTKSDKSRKNKKGKKLAVEAQVQAVPNKKPGGQGSLVSKVHLKFNEENEDDSDEEEKEEEEKLFSSGSESDDLYEEMLNPNSAENETIKNDSPPPKTAEKTEDKKEEFGVDTILETGRLFVRNLSYTCTEEDLRKLFEPFGPLTEVHLSISRDTKKPKGFAYILYMIPENALRAYSKLDGSIFLGRILHIIPGREKEQKKDESSEGSLSFKKQKEKELKENAQKDYNWNSLFIRSDTVLDAIAQKLGVPKASIMDVQGSDNLATRLAVAETNLIQETKSFLEAEGVVLDAFIKGAERSNTVILVKNLPFSTESLDLRKLFEKHGTVGRVVLPPTRAVALVEFFEPTEAKIAFKTLAYSRFKDAPLYLEWAPVKSLLPRDPTQSIPTPAPVVITETISNEADQLAEDSIEGVNTLFVKNINFATTKESLRQVFEPMGPIKSATIATKKNGSSVLSLGFGFVEFERKESLNRAIDELQGYILDGHALLLKKSHSGQASTNTKVNSKRKQTSADSETLNDASNDDSAKLLVRNIPFEASEREVRELFKSFAQLKRLRLPKRFDGRHRGFGFVEFLTHQEAVNAKQALSHTHLYGRHLVLEWAKKESLEGEEGIEQLRERTRKRMLISQSSSAATGKKFKLEGSGDEMELVKSTDEEDDDE